MLLLNKSETNPEGASGGLNNLELVNKYVMYIWRLQDCKRHL